MYKNALTEEDKQWFTALCDGAFTHSGNSCVLWFSEMLERFWNVSDFNVKSNNNIKSQNWRWGILEIQEKLHMGISDIT